MDIRRPTDVKRSHNAHSTHTSPAAAAAASFSSSAMSTYLRLYNARRRLDPTDPTIQKTAMWQQTLYEWRVCIVHVSDVLRWQRAWHPYAIAAAVTGVFAFVRIVQPTLLAAMALLGLMVTLASIFMPFIDDMLLSGLPWSAEREALYLMIIADGVRGQERLAAAISTFRQLRAVQPVLYYGVLAVALLAFAWLGIHVDSGVILYVLVLLMCLAPGCERTGLLHQCLAWLCDKINALAIQEEESTNSDHEEEVVME